jgi:hypothetical protein
MGREGDHEPPIGLGAEGKAKAAAAADALHLAAAFPPATGGAGHEPYAPMPEHRQRIGGTTQTAGMPCRTNAAATERDSVEALTTSPLAAAMRRVA